MDVDLGADGDPTAFLTDDALAELVGEALAPGAGAAMVTPEASPGLTPCGCRIQPTPFFPVTARDPPPLEVPPGQACE